jgi:1,4-dihydroxy-2-naphthoate octaprenyltransferase
MMAPSFFSRFAVYFQLGKFKIVELWLGFFVGVTLLGPRAVGEPRAVAILALILVAGIAVIAATCSLDDIAGVRDGVDQANHTGQTRWGVDKPILTGRLAEQSALKFVHFLGGTGVLAYGAVLVLAWPLPSFLVVVMTALMLIALNYSYGLKLSYRGAGELVIFAGGWGTVFIPYALVAKSWSGPLVVCAALVGALHAQVVMFSNTKDAAGDRATGRMTVAARLSKRGNKIYIASAFAFVWTCTLAVLSTGALPLRYALGLAPVWALQGYQLWAGFGREDWLRARLVGFRALRLGIVSLSIVNWTLHWS